MSDEMRVGYQFHHIQKSILLNLATNAPQRFSQLQPPRLPNNTFSYHLKKLLDSGYVKQTSEGYILTRKALKLIVYGVSHEKVKTVPKTISMIYITNSSGEILLISRNNRPFQGWYGLPSGLIHTGETLQDAARRELMEKTTIMTTQDLLPVGVLEFRYIEQKTRDIFVHAIGFVYGYTYSGRREELNDVMTKYGQLSWSKLGRSHILPEVAAVHDMIISGKFQHLSVSFEEPEDIPTLYTDRNIAYINAHDVSNESTMTAV